MLIATCILLFTTDATDANCHVLKFEVPVTLSLCFKFDRFYIYYLLLQSPTQRISNYSILCKVYRL